MADNQTPASATAEGNKGGKAPASSSSGKSSKRLAAALNDTALSSSALNAVPARSTSDDVTDKALIPAPAASAIEAVAGAVEKPAEEAGEFLDLPDEVSADAMKLDVAAKPKSKSQAETSAVKASAAKPGSDKTEAASSKVTDAEMPAAAPSDDSTPAAPVLSEETSVQSSSAQPVSGAPITKSAVSVPERAELPDTAPNSSTAHTVQPSSPSSALASSFASSFKDNIMDMSTNLTGFQDAMTQAQAKAQAAFEKSSSMLGEAGDFAKGNVEAMIQSSKIYAEGLQEIGGSMVAESRTAFESMTGDIKELAAAKSPTDFLKIQSEMVRKNIDNAVAYGSKNSETFLKLLSDSFAPLSGRVSLAVEKARQTAAIAPAANIAA